MDTNTKDHLLSYMRLATAKIHPLDKFKVVDYLADHGIVSYAQYIMALSSVKSTNWEVALVSA